MLESQNRYIVLNILFILLALFNLIFFNTEIRDLQSSSERLLNSSICLIYACGSILLLWFLLTNKTIFLRRLLLVNLFLSGAPLLYQVLSMMLFGFGYYNAGGSLGIVYLIYPMAVLLIFLYVHFSLLRLTKKVVN